MLSKRDGARVRVYRCCSFSGGWLARINWRSRSNRASADHSTLA